ncbi:formate dehydrogenase subunit gamma [Futiania mangrovi]|uniref:Formate dehydrogenase subunit gamma n=1 Tax=Futiania mangrovi TaxID=2959716 RepID=A0A9J6PAH9_9PROT|nr:formate dehydrogenase subunit gamma [Futiania mangrovii]MCP1335417.1 formate dehydrogenase subunit gamma [Futiania mangrovii]
MTMNQHRIAARVRVLFATLMLAVGLALAPGAVPALAQQSAPVAPTDPAGSLGPLGQSSDTDIWREIRRGNQFQTQVQNQGAGIMIQSEGEVWRNFRNGPLPYYGAWGLFGIVALLAVFFLIRGRIRIDEGMSGRTIERFNTIERAAHWLLASTFIILAITGLNLLYGRYFLPGLIGKEAFATISMWGKYAHNYLAFGFMLGLVMIFVLWVKDNIPGWTDVKWFLKGGGILGMGHPDSRRFNGGQKLIFWMVVLGGASLSMSGVALMWPFEFHFFAGTFDAINGIFGTSLPTALGPIQEQQLNAAWHAIVGLVMIVVIIAHIYIGSVGMEGAFDAMGSGQVDINWAKEHHNLWVEDMVRKGRADAPTGGHGTQPAE